MATMTNRQTGTVEPQTEYARNCIEEWNGFRKGDLVHVTGTYKSLFVFQYAHLRDGEVDEVTVVGGDHGYKTFRTFVAARVVAPSNAQRKKAKDLDANSRKGGDDANDATSDND